MNSPPNIVLILADDLGYSDLGCYGGEIRTPNLDHVAANGVRWTQFYNCARCCPTRASLLTGLYPHQAGIGFMEHGNRYNQTIYAALGRPEYRGSLAASRPTVAELLHEGGYQTFLSGKWHVGQRDASEWPCQRGFDRFYGILGGACSYWRPQDWGGLVDGNEPVPEVAHGFYTTDAFTGQAVRFIDAADSERPFFLYLAYTAPHWPLHAWPEDIARYAGRYALGWDTIRAERFTKQQGMGLFGPEDALSPRDPDSHAWDGEPDQAGMAHRMAVYAAMVDRMDQGVGRVLGALRRKAVLDNTLIVFLSDNGACAEPYNPSDPVPAGPAESNTGVLLPWANASNTPLRLFKHWTHEGGMRTPFIALWPGRIGGGGIGHGRYGHVKDLLPTFLDAAGIAVERDDFAGRSLLPWLTGGSEQDAEVLFMEHEGNRCVRDGRWKLVSYYNAKREAGAGTGPRTGAWELYDIEADPTELRDLAATHPDCVQAMAASYNEWAERTGVVDWETAVRAGGIFDPREAP